ncbi:MAG: hypothetical protein JXB00_13235 [Bacteroidales bacterium]|nr:hypothetical protein [Bacteroidales bacterium]
MYRKDYILRMVEMFGEMLRGILGMIRKKDFDEASAAIEHAYTELLHQKPEEILKISREKLPDMLQHEYDFNPQQIEIVAELLFAEAEMNFFQENYADGLQKFRKSLTIFKYLDREQKIYSPERQNRILGIENRITTIIEKQ